MRKFSLHRSPAQLEASSVLERLRHLGPVDNHLEAMSAATRLQHAA